MRTELSPQEKGTEFEEDFSVKYGGKLQPKSGAGIYHKLDIVDSKFLWSLKYTSKKSFSITRELFREVEREVSGPGGIGLDYIAGVAINLEGETYAMLKMDDLVGLLEQEVKVFKTDKVSEKRAKSKIPRLLRQEE